MAANFHPNFRDVNPMKFSAEYLIDSSDRLTGLKVHRIRKSLIIDEKSFDTGHSRGIGGSLAGIDQSAGPAGKNAVEWTVFHLKSPFVCRDLC